MRTIIQQPHRAAPCRTARSWVSYGSPVVLGLLIAACGSVTVSRFAPAPPRPQDCRLEVYASENEVDRGFETVCIIGVRTGTHIFAEKGVGGALNQARPQACECGADALILLTAREDATLLSGEGKATLRAIRYLDGKEEDGRTSHLRP